MATTVGKRTAGIAELFDKETSKRVGYRAFFRRPDGKETSLDWPTKEAARLFLAQVRVDKRSGTYVTPEQARTTVRDYGERWRKAKTHRQSSAEVVERALRLHLYPTFGDRAIGSVERHEMKEWLKDLAARRKPNSVRSIWGWASSLFAEAVDDGYLPRSPCRGVRLKLAETPPIVLPTQDEILAIVAELPPRWAALGLVAAQTGLRPGELLGLCAEQVHAVPPSISVDRQLRGAEVVMETKNKSSRRLVPIDEVTVQVLAAHMAQYPPGDGGLLFCRPDGKHMSRRAVSETWKRAVLRARIGRRVRLHDMRHYYATGLVADQVNLKAAQKHLGHSKASVTLDTYAHAQPEDDDKTRASVARRWSVPKSAVSTRYGQPVQRSDQGK